MKKNSILSGSCWALTQNPGVPGVPGASANADLITVETYVQQGKTIENQFLIYGLKCKKMYIFGYLRGPGGLYYLTLPILLSGYSLIHINVHVK